MLLLGHHTNPSFGVFIFFFDASSEGHLRSSLQSLHDVIKVPPFNHNVHHRGLWTEAAYGSLKPPPTRRLRRTYLHLSYSMTFTRLHDTSTAKIFSQTPRADNINSAAFWPSWDYGTQPMAMLTLPASSQIRLLLSCRSLPVDSIRLSLRT